MVWVVPADYQHFVLPPILQLQNHSEEDLLVCL
jgi:hypothetical protein